MKLVRSTFFKKEMNMDHFVKTATNEIEVSQHTSRIVSKSQQ